MDNDFSHSSEQFEPPNERPSGLSSEGAKAIQGESSDAGVWTEFGIIDAPVADLPQPEGITGPSDFDHHITYQGATAAVRQLRGIQRKVRAGWARNDFASADEAAGLDYANGTCRIYELFYGSDPVMLNKVGDVYTIVKGRHRIYAAKSAGLATIPARVIEKV